MVDIITAYKILNKSILRVANDCVMLKPLEIEEKKEIQVRLTDEIFDISKSVSSIKATVVAHNLSQYVNKFYGIRVLEENSVALDELLYKGKIDLTEFGEKL